MMTGRMLMMMMVMAQMWNYTSHFITSVISHSTEWGKYVLLSSPMSASEDSLLLLLPLCINVFFFFLKVESAKKMELVNRSSRKWKTNRCCDFTIVFYLYAFCCSRKSAIYSLYLKKKHTFCCEDISCWDEWATLMTESAQNLWIKTVILLQSFWFIIPKMSFRLCSCAHKEQQPSYYWRH